jgi:hypothetical protein
MTHGVEIALGTHQYVQRLLIPQIAVEGRAVHGMTRAHLRRIKRTAPINHLVHGIIQTVLLITDLHKEFVKDIVGVGGLEQIVTYMTQLHSRNVKHLTLDVLGILITVYATVFIMKTLLAQDKQIHHVLAGIVVGIFALEIIISEHVQEHGELSVMELRRVQT